MSDISTYAIVESGVVTNIVAWDGVSDWTPPQGSTANLIPDGSQVGIGYSFDGANYTAPAVSA